MKRFITLPLVFLLALAARAVAIPAKTPTDIADLQSKMIDCGEILADDELYESLFPDCGELTYEDGALAFEGWDGELLVSYSALELQFADESDATVERGAQPFELKRSHIGTVSAAPIHESGAVGRTSRVNVKLPGEAATMAIIQGEAAYVGNDRDAYNAVISSRGKADSDAHIYELLAGQDELRELSISYCGLTDIGRLEESLDTAKLESLSLTFNALEGEIDLSGFESLGYIFLDQNPELTEVILPDNSYIEVVSLAFTKVSSLDFLAGVDKLLTLDIKETAVTDLSPLAGKSVHTLSLSPECDFTGLAEIEGLVRLYVAGNHADCEALEAFAREQTEIEAIHFADEVVKLSENTVWSYN